MIAYGGRRCVANSDDPAIVLALNQPDNWLHLGSALVGLAIALCAVPHHRHRTDH